MMYCTNLQRHNCVRYFTALFAVLNFMLSPPPPAHNGVVFIRNIYIVEVVINHFVRFRLFSVLAANNHSFSIEVQNCY